MSPEQADSEEPPSPQNDVYSLGAVLYECLQTRPIDIPAGRKPLLENAAVCWNSFMRSLHHASFPSGVTGFDPSLAGDSFSTGSRLPADLDSITRKALAFDQQQRYSSARELAQDVRRLLMHQCVSAHPRTGRYVASVTGSEIEIAFSLQYPDSSEQ